MLTKELSFDSASAHAYVEALYKNILHRPADKAGLNSWIEVLRDGAKPHQVLEAFVNSPERAERAQLTGKAEEAVGAIDAASALRNGTGYHTPDELSRSPSGLTRVLLLGACFIESWAPTIRNSALGCDCDHVLVNNYARLPDSPPRPVSDYDLQIVQLPLRSVLPESSYFGLSYAAESEYEALFDEAKDRLLQLLDEVLRWNTENGLLTFVCNFMTPQQNPLGRMLPRYELRNIVYFIEQLNVALAAEMARHKNVFILDANQISAIHGQKFAKDDALWISSHGSILSDWDHEYDGARIETIRPVSSYYHLRVHDYIDAVWREAVAMYRTVRQIDAVKLVIFDLDDTLWRGVAAEGALERGHPLIEGWPLGIIEAIHFLKKRGVLVAIVSKNDDSRICELWPQIMEGKLSLDDFAIRKINWLPKAENIDEILSEVNLLPKNVVFVDDNPVERAAVQEAFPEIRTLGANPYAVRRALLWGSETQVAHISSESTKRTEMIQAQVKREGDRKQLSRADFLSSLNLQMKIFKIESTDDARFSRALELLNKTNQFNTTGQRWTFEMCTAHFSKNGVFYCLEVADKYSRYGLVGVGVTSGNFIAQWVMSCRVIGLEVEAAAITEIARRLSEREQAVTTAEVRETDTNILARDLYSKSGFRFEGGLWHRPAEDAYVLPKHTNLIE